jgi:histidine ammonia-lyase
VLPVIPVQGSVGASGDLAPLAHVALALVGEGEATAPAHAADPVAPGAHAEARRDLAGLDVMRAAGVAALELQAKEGLALLNGTQLSLALALEGLMRAERLLDAAIVCCAITVEGLAGSHSPFDDRIQRASRLPGQIEVRTPHPRTARHPTARSAAAMRTASGCRIRTRCAVCPRCSAPWSTRCATRAMCSVLRSTVSPTTR